MRSRINWLKWGDKNTKFLRATTVQRRQRNNISMLRTIEEERSGALTRWKQMTANVFRSLYSSVGSMDIQPVFNQCPSLVGPHESKHAMKCESARGKGCHFPIGSIKSIKDRMVLVDNSFIDNTGKSFHMTSLIWWDLSSTLAFSTLLWIKHIFPLSQNSLI